MGEPSGPGVSNTMDEPSGLGVSNTGNEKYHSLCFFNILSQLIQLLWSKAKGFNKIMVGSF